MRKIVNRTIAGFFVCAAAVMAQPIGFGIKGGLPLNDAFDVSNSSSPGLTAKNQKWIVGPQVELRLPAGLGIEFDALYTKVDVTTPLSAAGSVASAPFDVSSWEFPLLLKYRFGGPSVGVASVRPFVDVGASFRRLGDVGQIANFITGSNGGSANKNSTGFVVGGGLDIRALVIHFTPEIRFTRWGTGTLLEGAGNVFRLNQNQAQFLVGFTF